MSTRATNIIRAILIGILAGGAAFFTTFWCLALPAKVHAWILIALTGIFALTDIYFRSLLSELGALLRRGSYSVWQLEELNQTVPRHRKSVMIAWNWSFGLKASVGLASALLLWEGMPAWSAPLTEYVGYTFLGVSLFLAVWARRSFRSLEKMVDDLTMKEISLKEKRRLKQELNMGEEFDFSKDKLASGYTKPPSPQNH